MKRLVEKYPEGYKVNKQSVPFVAKKVEDEDISVLVQEIHI